MLKRPRLVHQACSQRQSNNGLLKCACRYSQLPNSFAMSRKRNAAPVTLWTAFALIGIMNCFLIQAAWGIVARHGLDNERRNAPIPEPPQLLAACSPMEASPNSGPWETSPSCVQPVHVIRIAISPGARSCGSGLGSRVSICKANALLSVHTSLNLLELRLSSE